MSAPQRLADRVGVARRRRFVGRTGEQDLFRSALAAPDLPFCILFLYGPGGIGKTTLLREFVRLSEEAGIQAIHLDGRNIDPSPDSFVSAMRNALNLDPAETPLHYLASHPARRVLLVDTYEVLAPLDDWLRDVFLPQLPEDTLIVMADRNPPAPEWCADPGWESVVRTLPLRNLAPVESMDYLLRRGVPEEQHPTVLEFTHGHPLALSLVADVFAQRPALRFLPDAAPDVVKTLLEQFVQKVPGPLHRQALEACALLRLTTEALLGQMLAQQDVHELFEWLRELSFIESGQLGLFPHDLAREALTADLRWRNPDWYAELHTRARNYYATRLQQAPQHEQQRILFDYIYLHRENPVLRTFIDWQETGTTFLPDSLRQSDVPELLAMVAQHEGDDSAKLAAHWIGLQPESVLVFRDVEQQPAGFMMMLALEKAGLDELGADPATRLAWDYLMTQAPLRPGERATHFRFWMARDSYQALSSVQSIVFANAARHYLTAPGLAFSFFPCADPDFWAAGFGYVDLERLRDADFEVGGHRYGVYSHDWRRVTPMGWLALLAEREMAVAPSAPPAPRHSQSPVVLSRPEFETAVHAALRDNLNRDALRTSPLLRSRLIVDRAGQGAGQAERVEALRSMIGDAAESLRSSPRRDKGYQALYHTYLHPAPTQERAAELLDLPFSTFRRHLKTGISLVTEILWQQEIGGAEK